MRIDRDRACQELGLTPEVYQELLRVYACEFHRHLTQIVEAVSRQQWDSARFAAHALKGASLNMRLDDIATVAKRLEACFSSSEGLGGIDKDIDFLKMVLEEID